MIYIRRVIKLPFIFAFAALLLLSACSDPEFDKAKESLKTAEVDLNHLATALDQSTNAASLPNLKYLRLYANSVRKISPDMNELISTLEAEGTTKGGSYLFLMQRLDAAEKSFIKDADKSREMAIRVSEEASAVSTASKLDVFNDSLVDVVNVLADMSEGKLPKLQFEETADKSMPPTQHLVGNPRYGGWRYGSGGNIWAWYGQYRLFSDVLGWGSGYRYNQNNWYRNRSASYHGDIGRHYYGSRSQTKTWGNISRKHADVKTNKVPASKLKSFKSTQRLSTYAPRTPTAPRSMAKTYASTYSNTRSSPSRKSGFGGRSGGK